MGLRAFARAQGWALSSVQRAIKSGRLKDSIARDAKGRWKILDPVKAKAEWSAHTRPRVDSRKENPTTEMSDLARATLRERIARAESFELETERKRGTLVPVVEMDRLLASIGITFRTGLLGLPTRARQRLPHLTAKDMLVLDRLARDLLDEYAAQAKKFTDRRAS